MVKKSIVVCGLLISICMPTWFSIAYAESPNNTTVRIEKDYDASWQAAMATITEVQACKGCLFSITSSDKSAGVISASLNREHQITGQINIHVAKINERETSLTVNASVSQYKSWSNLYGAKFYEKWEDIDSDLASKIADQTALVANDFYGRADTDTFLKVYADRLKINAGDYMTLDYVLYVRYDTTYQGTDRELKIENQLINVIMKHPESEGGGYYEKGPYFGIGPMWDDVRKMPKIITIGEGSPSANILFPNDLIKSVNDEEAKSIPNLMELLRKQPLNEETKFSVVRDGKEMDFHIVPGNSWSEASLLNQDSSVRFGFDARFNEKDKVLSVDRGDELSTLMAGDVVKEVDGLPIHSLNDWRKITNALQEEKTYHFTVARNGEEVRFEIKPRREKIFFTAEYYPTTPNDIKKKEVELNGKKYLVATTQKIKIRFNQRGNFSIDPGSIKVKTSIWGMASTRVLEAEPLKITVT